MKLRVLPERLSVVKLSAAEEIKLDEPICFAAHTGSEVSLVCREDRVPEGALMREDGWRGFYVEGTLEFSLVGILAGISAALAGAGVAMFALSTFDTDYILVKDEMLKEALDALEKAEYVVDNDMPD